MKANGWSLKKDFKHSFQIKHTVQMRQVQNAGHRSQVRSQVTGHRAQGLGHRSQVTRHRSQGTGYRAQVIGHRKRSKNS